MTLFNRAEVTLEVVMFDAALEGDNRRNFSDPFGR